MKVVRATSKALKPKDRQVPGDLPVEFKALTEKQRQFVVFFAITRNGTKAVQMAGYEGDYGTLGQTAYENLKKPEILKALDAYTRPFFDQQGMTLARTLEHIADIAYAPWHEFIQVKEKSGRVVNTKINLTDKLKALEMILKMFRLIGSKEDTEFTQFIDQSQHLHVHKPATTVEEARRALLEYLEQRKMP